MKNFLFLLSTQPIPRFMKQINYLAKDCIVTVAYYNRPAVVNMNHKLDSAVNVIEIANIHHGKNYLNRLIVYLKSISKIHKLIKLNNYDAILINGLDVLIPLSISSYKNKLDNTILEIGDLHKYVFKHNLISDAFKFVEKHLVTKFVTKLIVTSDKFYSLYYKDLVSDYFVLENKPLIKMLPLPKNTVKEKLDIIRIGVIGVIRKEALLFLINTVANKKNFIVKIYGEGIGEDEIKYVSKLYDNINFYGRYDFFEEISDIYNSIDIVYIVYETRSTISNINLALPNKLYESMYYKKPVIVSKNTYLSERVEKLNIGYVINYGVSQELLDVLDDFSNNKERFKGNFECISKSEYIADNDYIKLKEFIF